MRTSLSMLVVTLSLVAPAGVLACSSSSSPPPAAPQADGGGALDGSSLTDAATPGDAGSSDATTPESGNPDGEGGTAADAPSGTCGNPTPLTLNTGVYDGANFTLTPGTIVNNGWQLTGNAVAGSISYGFGIQFTTMPTADKDYNLVAYTSPTQGPNDAFVYVSVVQGAGYVNWKSGDGSGCKVRVTVAGGVVTATYNDVALSGTLADGGGATKTASATISK